MVAIAAMTVLGGAVANVMDKSQQAYSEWYRENCGQPHDLRAIWDAAWQASRKQTLGEARERCEHIAREWMFVMDPEAADVAEQCVTAIRSLEGNATKETT